MATIGSRLKAIRISQGLKLKDVKAGTGLAISTIYNAENKASCTMLTFRALIVFYGVSPAQLYQIILNKEA